MHSPKRRLRRRRRKPMKMKSEESTDMATHGDCCCCCYSYCCTGVQISAAVLDRLRLFGRRDVRAPVGGASRVGRPTRLQGPRPPLSPSLLHNKNIELDQSLNQIRVTTRAIRITRKIRPPSLKERKKEKSLFFL